MSKDTNRLLGHADEADGIEEYDNPLPDWWLGLFWFTIIWAIAYFAHYHLIADRSQEKAFLAELAAAEERWPAGEAAGGVAFAMTDEAITAGEPIYAQNCAACHAAGMEGLIGPSFLDDEWIHGGTAAEVIYTIENGVLDKGMVAWKGILSPEQINSVAAYILDRHAEATGRSLDDILREPAAPGDESEPGDAEAADTGAITSGAAGAATED